MTLASDLPEVWVSRCRHLPAVLATLFAILLCCGNCRAATEAPTIVLIGFAGPLSGDAARVGQSMEKAAELALTEANAHNPRIDGKPVQFRLLSQDDQGKPRIAALVADYLVKAGVVAVIGHWQSTASLAGAPIYHAAGIPQISPGSSNSQLTAHGDNNVFRVVGRDKDISNLCARFSQQTLQAKRIAVISDDTIYGTTLASQFTSSLDLKQSLIVTQISVSSATSDFNAAINALKISKPDLLFFGGQTAQAAVLQTNLQRTGTHVRLIAPGIVGPAYLQLAGAAAEGTLGISTGVPQTQMRGWKKFKDKFIATYDDYIDYYAPFAYDAANVIIAAIRQANSVAPDKLNAALHSLVLQGLTGPISFDAQGNLNNPPYTVFRAQDGKWLPVQVFGGK